ncbi:MAG: hypothetical protein V1934_01285 [Methanobacteriota archaeon]
MDTARFTRGGCEILFLPVIRGLVSEGENVERHAREFVPDAVALSISPEELKALRAHDGKPLEPLCGTVEENVYESGLCQFGEVERPPRCFTAAVKISDELKARVVGVDLTEEEFTRSYVSLVSGWDFVRRTLWRNRISSARFDQSSAEAFVLDWDRRLRKVRGYDLLEQRREAQIAKAVSELSGRSKRLLAIVELERARGVLKRLENDAPGDQ